MTIESFKSWQDFEIAERRRVGTFQLSVDNLARDLYMEIDTSGDDFKEHEVMELNFD
ncbi:MAG: hypothetical protein JXR91_02765 [Deltaproteobacteria bacterium]|nr:hypothetical protein [Deltaproteobacteria bacterium]